VEVGESPYIYGIHDWTSESAAFIQGASSGSDCVRGWIMIAEAIGDSGSSGGTDFTSLTSAGFGVIVRLDYDWGAGTLPSPDRFDEFAATFADYVRNSRGGVHVWIAANEPNLMWGGRNFSPQEYGDAYMMIRDAVHAVPGHADDQVLVAAVGIWADVPELYGDWLYSYFAGILDRIGDNYDGFSVHAYTREFSAGAISSDMMWPDGVHMWHFHFRVYRDVLDYLRGRGILSVPLYITETGNVCDPPCDPYPDADMGYFVAMYEEINDWNASHPDQVIRAVTPYRWTSGDDGTGRDFCIGCAGGLQADIANAISFGYRWTTSGCPGSVTPGCGRDEDCDAGEICNLDSGECEPGPACGSDADCAPGSICHMHDGICVPSSRGEGWLEFTPDPARVGTTVTIDAFHETLGLMHVSVEVAGPSGAVPDEWVDLIDGEPPVCQWQWTANPPVEGTYRVTFTADPAETVYAIGYFHALTSPSDVPPELYPEDRVEPADFMEAPGEHSPDVMFPESDGSDVPGMDSTVDGDGGPAAISGGCGC